MFLEYSLASEDTTGVDSTALEEGMSSQPTKKKKRRESNNNNNSNDLMSDEESSASGAVIVLICLTAIQGMLAEMVASFRFSVCEFLRSFFVDHSYGCIGFSIGPAFVELGLDFLSIGLFREGSFGTNVLYGSAGVAAEVTFSLTDKFECLFSVSGYSEIGLYAGVLSVGSVYLSRGIEADVDCLSITSKLETPNL